MTHPSPIYRRILRRRYLLLLVYTMEISQGGSAQMRRRTFVETYSRRVRGDYETYI